MAKKKRLARKPKELRIGTGRGTKELFHFLLPRKQKYSQEKNLTVHKRKRRWKHKRLKKRFPLHAHACSSRFPSFSLPGLHCDLFCFPLTQILRQFFSPLCCYALCLFLCFIALSVLFSFELHCFKEGRV